MMSEFDKLRDRPHIPDYGIEESDKGLLSWEFVRTELKNAKNYWLSTTKPNGDPHAIPIWASWINVQFFFGGGPDTQNRKNLEKNPHKKFKRIIKENIILIILNHFTMLKLIKSSLGT
jgi:hypothetical protein